MSKAMTPTQRLAAYKRWGITVVEVTRGGVSWRDHRRPASTGPWGDMHGTLTHHTGPWSTVAGMIALLWVGRSDLPGPLCDEATAPDGRLYMIASGRANHAGRIARNIHNALLADKPLPLPGPDAVDGNAELYGNEVIHKGDDSPYPPVQIEAAVKAAAAKCEFHGWTANSATLHLRVTTRKRDWSAFSHSHAAFVKLVAAALSVGPSWQYPPAHEVKRVKVLYRTPTSTRPYVLDPTGLVIRPVAFSTVDTWRKTWEVVVLTMPADSPVWLLPKAS